MLHVPHNGVAVSSRRSCEYAFALIVRLRVRQEVLLRS